MSQDFIKPLLVPPGADLIESIQGLGSTNNSWTIDKYKHFFTTHFPQVSNKLVRFILSLVIKEF